jgi:hypothetical protein
MSTLSRRHHARSSQGETRPFEGMRTVNLHAAGVDIGAHEIMACVPDGDDQQLVRAFGTTPLIVSRWRTGASIVVSRRLLWNPRACSGCRCSRPWKRVASNVV